MPSRVLRARISDRSALHREFDRIREQEALPAAFPDEVLAEAERATTAPRQPTQDRTDIPFVTLDPPSSTDLDQAFHLQRRNGGGYLVRYAIADVAAFVDPHGAVAQEAWRRVVTLYCPDTRVPLHPPVLSEQAASLWPDGPRPAVLWSIGINDLGEITEVDVERAWVRSRAKLGYPDVQAALEAGTTDDMVALLPDVGALLAAAELARGGASLPLPAQEIEEGPGGYRLGYRNPLPVEQHNAQLSLLTGRAAARLMLDVGSGVLRTMPPPDERDVRRLRRVAAGLQVDWPTDVSYGELLATIGPELSPTEVAFLNEAASLFRGASYTVVGDSPNGGDSTGVATDVSQPAPGPAPEPAPPPLTHAAIAAPYAHCTAPLRRLVDRFVNEVCLAAAAGRPTPEWATAALRGLPDQMQAGTSRARAVERQVLDAVEVAVMRRHAQRTMTGVVVETDEKRGRCEVAVTNPAVVARCHPALPLGSTARVRLAPESLADGRVRFVAL